MKIKTKLFLAFVFLAVMAVLLGVTFSIFSISKRSDRMIQQLLASFKKNTESVFYEYLGELNRKALFLSELQEVVQNMDNPDRLLLTLEFKSFFFPNTNINILDKKGLLLLKQKNLPLSFIGEKNLADFPFFKDSRDPLLREAGIFEISGNLLMAAISPIVNQETFDIKGFVLLETLLNLEFADMVKEKAKANLLIYSNSKPLASTLTDVNGEMLFLPSAKLPDGTWIRFQNSDTRFSLGKFDIESYEKKKIGEVFVAVEIEEILTSRKVSIITLLGATAIIGLLVVITSIFLGKKMTAPIVTLSQGAEAIAQGNYDIRMDISSRDEIGNLAAVFNKMTDSLKIQREEILQLQQFFENIVKHSPSAIVIGNEVSEIITMNPAAEQMLAASLEHAKSKGIFEVLKPLKHLKEEYVKVMLSGNPFFHERFTVVDEGGIEKNLRVMMYKIPLPGAPAAVMQMEDISEKFELEERLVHAQKLGTLGELLSRFTHEFNNLMTGLIGHVSLLRKEIGENNPMQQRAFLVEDVALRAYNLGKDILNFSRREKLVKEKVNVAEAVQTVVAMLGKTVLKRIELERKFADESFWILANKEKFLLALFNVFINATDAIQSVQRDPGKITVTVDRIFNSREEKNYIRIGISDNGSGIEKKIIGKIFEPYFTTKKDKGTGLGLTTVKEIIEENSGWIEIESEIGSGTAIILFLPEYLV